MSEEAPADGIRKPFDPPKSRWRPWHSPAWQKFLHVAYYPRGRLVPTILCIVGGWLIVYNTSVRLIKGPDHPLNNYGWERARERGQLSDEQLHKEQILRKFDNQLTEMMVEAFFWKHKQSGVFEDPIVHDTLF